MYHFPMAIYFIDREYAFDKNERKMKKKNAEEEKKIR